MAGDGVIRKGWNTWGLAGKRFIALVLKGKKEKKEKKVNEKKRKKHSAPGVPE